MKARGLRSESLFLIFMPYNAPINVKPQDINFPTLVPIAVVNTPDPWAKNNCFDYFNVNSIFIYNKISKFGHKIYMSRTDHLIDLVHPSSRMYTAGGTIYCTGHTESI